MANKYCHATQLAAYFFAAMSKDEIEAALVRGREETGIAVKDLRRMCLVGGLELLARGELKISSSAKSLVWRLGGRRVKS